MWQGGERDLERLRARFAAWVATKLPDAHDVHVAALTSPISNGFSNDTLFADLSWEEDGRARTVSSVVRLEPSGDTVFPSYDLAAQFRVMDALAPTGVPVPRMLWLEQDRSVLGAPFYVMERVDGRIPSDTPTYHVGGWMTEIEPAARAAIWWSGLEALAAIHRLDPHPLGLGFLAPPPPGSDSLDRQLAYYERYIAWAGGGRPQPACEAALDWLERNRPTARVRDGLCWGDSRLGNMIFRDGRCVAVLDWEMSVLGDPEQDLAWWLYFDRHHSEGCDAERLAGIPSREETVRGYEESTGRPVRHLEYYEIFAAFRFTAIMIRVAHQLVGRGILPADSDFETNNTATRLLERMLAER